MTESETMLSRVAESQYWMSRYLERAENTARLVDVFLHFILDAPDVIEKRRLRNLQESLLFAPAPAADLGDSETLLISLAFDNDNPASISANITAARENARQIREQISSEMWMQINKLYLDVQSSRAETLWNTSPHAFLLSVKEGSHLFQGITDATMNHNQGWHFIQIGRYIERTMNLLRLLDVHFDHTSLAFHNGVTTDHYFELVSILKSVSAFEAYCKVYTPNTQTRWITEFLLFNAEFPRSLRFCVETIQVSLMALADMTGRSKNSRLYRLAGRLQSNVSYDEIGDIGNLHSYLEDVRQQIAQIHDMLFNTYITYSIDVAL